jgi:hypothetical protein
MLRNLTLLTLLFTVACDAPSETTRSSERVAVEDDDAALDALPELAADLRWDDGLEEFLDRGCDAGACAWAWGAALDGLAEELPAIPASDDEAEAPASLTAAADPAAAGSKVVKVTNVHCYETQDVGEDEPYLLMNGSKVWSRTGVQNGKSYAINVSRAPYVLVELWEQDVSNNDKIGSFGVSSSKANGNYSIGLTGANGHYRVYYTVSTQ